MFKPRNLITLAAASIAVAAALFLSSGSNTQAQPADVCNPFIPFDCPTPEEPVFIATIGCNPLVPGSCLGFPGELPAGSIAEGTCSVSYPTTCLPPSGADWDCAGGNGDGPNYVEGPLLALPPDPYDLDADNDGIGCEDDDLHNSGSNLTAPAPASGSTCDPHYPTICVPPPPPDLNCGDIPFTDFAVLPGDPHGFDGDNDGTGCETT